MVFLVKQFWSSKFWRVAGNLQNRTLSNISDTIFNREIQFKVEIGYVCFIYLSLVTLRVLKTFLGECRLRSYTALPNWSKETLVLVDTSFCSYSYQGDVFQFELSSRKAREEIENKTNRHSVTQHRPEKWRRAVPCLMQPARSFTKNNEKVTRERWVASELKPKRLTAQATPASIVRGKESLRKMRC